MAMFWNYLFEAISCVVGLLRHISFTDNDRSISFMAVIIFVVAGSIIVSLVKNIDVKNFRRSRKSEK